MATLDDIIAKTTPVERTVRLCVGGALYSEYEAIRSEQERHLNDYMNSTRLAQGTDDYATHLQAEKDRLEAELADSTFEFKFHAVSPKRWSDLLTSHARADGGLDMEAFSVEAIAATCFEPEGLDDKEQLTKLLDSLSPAQQGELVDAAWEVNTTVPKGMNYSAA